jgi:hypothetical protein
MNGRSSLSTRATTCAKAKAQHMLGANYRPHPNLVIRPELRFEDFDPVIGREDQTLFGIDAVFTF